MWKLDHKEGWMPKNWCFWTVVLENTPESPLDYREIKPVNPKGNWPWIFTGPMLKAPVLWPPDAKNLLSGKDPDAGKDWGVRRRGQQRTRWLDGIIDSMDIESGQTPGDGEEQGSLACCSPWRHKESDMTEQLDNNNIPASNCQRFPTVLKIHASSKSQGPTFQTLLPL